MDNKLLDIQSNEFKESLTILANKYGAKLYDFKGKIEIKVNGYVIFLEQRNKHWDWVGVSVWRNFMEVRGKANYNNEFNLLRDVTELLDTYSKEESEGVHCVFGLGKDMFSGKLVKGFKEIAEEYGVEFKRTNRHLFLSKNENEYVSVGSIGVNRFYVAGVANNRPISSLYCHNDSAVFSAIRANLETNLGVKPIDKEAVGLELPTTVANVLKGIAGEYGLDYTRTTSHVFLHKSAGNFIVISRTDIDDCEYRIALTVAEQEIRCLLCKNLENLLNAVDSYLTKGLCVEPINKPKYANLEMIKRSKDFVINDNDANEIIVDFDEPYNPYYATIKDGEITYGIYVEDEEHIKIDMDKINQLKEVCEFIIG